MSACYIKNEKKNKHENKILIAFFRYTAAAMI